MLDFYFDFMSPYAYLASVRLPSIAQRFGVEVSYHPIDLGIAKFSIGNTGPPNRELHVKRNHLARDLQRWAQRYEIPLRFPERLDSRLLNTGFFYAKHRSRAAEYLRHGFHRVWGEGNSPDDIVVFRSICKTLNWDLEDFIHYINSESGSRAYSQSTSAAISNQVFGVPMVKIGAEMWWGNDRLDFVIDYLESVEDGKR